ncbi:putative spermidine/putrescine transport system ATP-binding protein [Franzmannia pantelleriensis]|uniref:Putative spermidine/putrescine transport system ATP-binding protein n=1 Tax=Franzmannia pantelleriensis TaxID=48727 RepID=A0A1G9WR34_9GAMM|nr:ABC transporter ATP-binding protein [Halomonas pantelleriensis]SDM86626.1 putative spermidine/putrescine transport system ATP-binding protein [Halomonas pantelleriensis]
MNSSVSIDLEACGRTFAGGHTALHPLDLNIAAGETLVLLGPSGCGKTTTLRLISGLERPDPNGRVRFDQRDVTPLPIEKRKVGMVFQSYALFPNMNVAANIAYGLRIQRLPATEIQQRIDAVMAMTDLKGFGERRIDELSGGQKQRVALARAIAVRPRVLLFDEPLAALDAKLRDRLRIEIARLLKELGITAVYVTHDQSEAMALGDRIAVMHQGRIAQLGTPQEIYHRPASTFVADFIGAVNRLPVLAAGAAGRLVVHGGELHSPHLRGKRTLYCRPEDIHVVALDAAAIRGRVVESVFLGQSQRLLVDTGSDAPLQVDTGSRRQWRAGEAIGLAIPPEVLFHPEQQPRTEEVAHG